MMALVYAVQGAFWPLLAGHLQDLRLDGRARGWIFATMALGAMAVPLGVGHLVDSRWPTQRYLALAYATAAALLALLSMGFVADGRELFLFFLVFWMVVAPCYGLSNSLAMRHLEDPGRNFGAVRLWGTIGWMLSGWMVTLAMVLRDWSGGPPGAYPAFYLAAILSAGLAAFSLALPDTPPLAHADAAGLRFGEGLSMLLERDIVVLLVTAFGVYLTTPMAYQVVPSYLEFRGLPRSWVATAMTLSQVPEVAFLAILPAMLRRTGYKATLGIGIGAWFLRFLSLLAVPSLGTAILGGVLQGVGIGCFTVGGQIYLDSRAHTRQRATAQGLFLVLTTGLGSLLGSLMAGELMAARTIDHVLVFLIPCVIDGAMIIFFLLGFRSHVPMVDRAGATTAAPPLRLYALRGMVGRVGTLVTESADG
jgi:MFS family permease